MSLKRKREELPSDEEAELDAEAMDFDLDTIDQLLDQVPEVRCFVTYFVSHFRWKPWILCQ